MIYINLILIPICAASAVDRFYDNDRFWSWLYIAGVIINLLAVGVNVK